MDLGAVYTDDGACHGDATPRVCDGCGTDTTLLDTRGGGPRGGGPRTDVLPDSSWIDPVDPGQDGRRPVAACSRPCMEEVRQRLAARPYATVELWAGKVFRAVTAHRGPLSARELEHATGLTTPQIRAAFAWLDEHLL